MRALSRGPAAPPSMKQVTAMPWYRPSMSLPCSPIFSL
jgi:hypothetical protein